MHTVHTLKMGGIASYKLFFGFISTDFISGHAHDAFTLQRCKMLHCGILLLCTVERGSLSVS